MSKVILKNYRIRELHFKSRTAGKTTIELEQRQSFKVHYIEGRNECIGQCRIEINDKGKEASFAISMDVESLFSYEPGTEKGELHHTIYKELFPYVRVLINNLTVSAGMPPLTVRSIDIGSVQKASTSASTIIQ